MASPPVKAAPRALAAERLAASGLKDTHGKAMGLEAVQSAAALDSHFYALPALLIPYWHPTKPTERLAAPGAPPFYRARYLAEPSQGFATIAGEKPPRYVQPLGSAVHAYFPRDVGIDWKKACADPSVPLLITEGELKAAKACAEGYACIGLGGVWSFRSTPRSQLFIPDLELVRWAGRLTYIVFDSDARGNPDICAAMQTLGEELAMRGALPELVTLPSVVEGAKTGLDDFLLASEDGVLEGVLKDAVPYTLAEPLWDLNKVVTYVVDPGMVVISATGQKLSPAAFREHAYAPVTYVERKIKANGTITLHPTSAAAEWLKWPLRSQVGKLTYAPGQPRIFGSNGSAAFNTWKGWGCEPKKGTVKPWRELLESIFKTERASMQRFERWCAYPFQKPGAKLFTSWVVHGKMTGTGKSSLGYSLGRLHGPNFIEIRQRDLQANFNEWAVDKTLVLGDDISGSDKRHDADILKTMITQQKVRINIKHVPSYEVPDCMNYLWTSNHADSFFLEDDDRRFDIHEVTGEPLSPEFFDAYYKWLDGEGAPALFHHLLNLDLGDFSATARAPLTPSKRRMIYDTKSDVAEWCARLMENPDAFLRTGDIVVERALWTSRELLAIYDPVSRTRVTANGLARELKKAGGLPVAGGQPVRVGDDQDRYLAVREPQRWARASLKEIRQHLGAKAPRK